LVGLEIPATLLALMPGEWRSVLQLVVAVLITLLAARALFVFAMVGLSHIGSRERLGLREAVVLAWAGARGPVSGLAAFSIPAAGLTVEYRDEHRILLATTFCVIAATLLLSPTLGFVARLVRVRPDDEGERSQALKAALVARALEALDQAAEQGILDGQPIDAKAERAVRAQLNALLPVDEGPQRPESGDDIWRLEGLVLRAQYEELLRLRDEEGMSDALVRPVMAALDLQSEAHKGRARPSGAA
ncbi:MAG: cation:proton antiporter, partial [Ilumatobacteraceae bacterium]